MLNSEAITGTHPMFNVWEMLSCKHWAHKAPKSSQSETEEMKWQNCHH